MWKKLSNQGKLLVLFLIISSVLFTPFFVSSSLADIKTTNSLFGDHSIISGRDIIQSIIVGLLTSLLYLVVYLLILWPFGYTHSSIFSRLRVVFAAILSIGIFLFSWSIIVDPSSNYLVIQMYYLVMGVGLLILPFVFARMEG